MSITTAPTIGQTTRRGVTPPPRSFQQRMDALARANHVRIHRAEVKRKLKARELVLADVILTGADPILGGDLLLDTMSVYELILGAPKFGKVKTRKVLQAARVSPSKTVGGLTQRQRLELATLTRR